jgi:hypothetical protein
VSAVTVGADVIKVTVKAGNLTHYYIARRGDAKIYMGTYFTSEPDTLNLARFIVRVPIARLPNGPAPSDLRGNTGAIEASDVFGMPNGETRSKHYSNMRLKDWQTIGATGTNVGLWIVRDNNEGNSGGPFYRSLLNQATSTNQEITYIINYGEGQTEPLRTKILNTYTMVFNDGAAPAPVDTSWLGTLGLTGWVGPEARGTVSGAGITAPATGCPAYQRKDVNGTLTLRFNQRASQIVPLRLRVGITDAFAGGRPKAQVNGWVSANPPASTQPSSRTLTVGTYRGNNTMYTFDIPATELVVGQNVLTLTAISGSSGIRFLSPGYSYDALDLIPTP